MTCREKLPPEEYAIRMRELLELAVPRAIREPQACIAFATRARALALAQGDRSQAASLLNLMAFAARRLDQPARALLWLRRAARETPEDVGTWEGLALLEEVLAVQARGKGEPDRAARYSSLSAAHRHIAATLGLRSSSLTDEKKATVEAIRMLLARVGPKK